MAIEITTVVGDEELRRFLAIRNLVAYRQLSVATWKAETDLILDGLTLLATENGRDIGAGDIAWSTIGRESGLALLDAWVLPDSRRQGVGSSLVGRLTSFARECGIERVSTSVVDGDEDSLAFVLRRGLQANGGGRFGHLALNAAEHAMPVQAPTGVILNSLSERPETIRAIYALETSVWPEIPSVADEPIPSFEAWEAVMNGASACLPELSIIATRDDAVIGWLQTFEYGEETVVIGMTAVHPSARRTGIGRLLKAELARRAVLSGRRRIDTYNDGTNDGIRALNESLGYVYGPRIILLDGPLPAAV